MRIENPRVTGSIPVLGTTLSPNKNNRFWLVLQAVSAFSMSRRVATDFQAITTGANHPRQIHAT
jgi:hypothetical protein